MPQRTHDWLTQASAEIEAARTLFGAGHWSWCCFTSQQAAEKALKAVCEHHRMPQVGHNLNRIVHALVSAIPVPEEIAASASRLNQLYIPTRFPYAFPEGAPAEQFFEADARQALRDAEDMLKWSSSNISAH